MKIQTMKKLIYNICCKFFFRVTYKGTENLKLHKQFLICPNHSHYFDPFFIYPVTDNVSIMAKKELFKYKLLAKLFKKYNVFPVNRNKKDPSSLFNALEVFNTNEPRELLIFPEGKIIKKDKDIRKSYKKGATYISAKLQIPIIPAYITRRPHLFSKVTITFGKPILMNKNLTNNKKELIEASKQLVNTIYDLNSKR